MQTIQIIYGGEQTRRLQYANATAVSISGDANSTKFVFSIPATYSTYVAYIEWGLEVKDDKCKIINPIYLLDAENSFTIPAEITKEGGGKNVSFNLKFSNADGSYVERSLPLTVYINRSGMTRGYDVFYSYIDLITEEASQRKQLEEKFHTTTDRNFVDDTSFTIISEDDGLHTTYNLINPYTGISSQKEFITPISSTSSLGVVKSSDELGKISVDENGLMQENKKYLSTIIDKSNWIDNMQDIVVEGISSNNMVLFSTPDSTIEGQEYRNQDYAILSEIKVDSIGNGYIRVRCSSVPTVDILAEFIIL